MEQGVVSRAKDPGTWKRLLYMILFSVIFQVVEFVLFIVVVTQFAFKLIAGKANGRLRTFGANLGVYVQEIIAFLTYYTEEMPYPFDAWPNQPPPDEEPASAPPSPGA